MAVWTAPITWVNGAVTASTMNTEVRDHLTWMKNALDLVTNSTAADSGDGSHLHSTRATNAGVAFQAKITGDAGNRFRIYANGDMAWGTGGGTPVTLAFFENGGIRFGPRPLSAPGMLRIGTKTGAYADADIDAGYTGVTSGLIGGIDTATNRLYVKVGGTWRFVVLT